MYGAPSDDPRERFIAQFEWDGAEAIYRANRIGPAYRVSADEYDAFLDAYDRQSRNTNWLCVVGYLTIGAIVLFVPPITAFFSSGPGNRPVPFFWWVLAVASLWLARRRLVVAPSRVLRRTRIAIAPALSGDESLSRTIGERSWESLFGEGVVLCLLMLALALLSDFFRQGLDLTLGIAALVCVGGVTGTLMQVSRKWRFERRQRRVGQPVGFRS
ncbi:MAG: hypothetical protein ACTHJR_09880 [Sphingomonas sp.]|uniref:hypothetical protein n=1 Tax=Sphingomonas sp. TaxID=28214 RepID=UPI003F7E5511